MSVVKTAIIPLQDMATVGAACSVSSLRETAPAHARRVETGRPTGTTLLATPSHSPRGAVHSNSHLSMAEGQPPLGAPGGVRPVGWGTPRTCALPATPR